VEAPSIGENLDDLSTLEDLVVLQAYQTGEPHLRAHVRWMSSLEYITPQTMAMVCALINHLELEAHAHMYLANPFLHSHPVWDSGASHHLTGEASEVTRSRQPPHRLSKIIGINGSALPVKAVGTMRGLQGVLLSPTAEQTLVSVGSYLDQHGGELHFTPSTVLHEHKEQGKSVVGCRQEDGLYRVTSWPSALLGKKDIQFQLLRERVHALHRCFGHASRNRLRTILKQNKIRGLAPHHVDLLSACDSCQLGKSKHASAPKVARTKATSFGERIVSDNSGVLRVRSLGGANAANVTVDEASSWVWATPISGGSHTYNVIKHIIQVELHQRSEHAVHFFRSDGGGDLCSARMDRLLRRHSIAREKTCAGTSHQNGKAERYIGVLFAMIRTFLHDSRLPPKFWSEALCAAAYVHNRLPLTGRADGKSPYELRYGKAPDIAGLRPFGAGCTVALQKRQLQGKHLPRAQQGIMVGYGYVAGQKGYRIYTPATATVVTSTSVVFSSLHHGARRRRRDQPELHSTPDEVAQMLSDFDRRSVLPPPFAGGNNNNNNTANATRNTCNNNDRTNHDHGHSGDDPSDNENDSGSSDEGKDSGNEGKDSGNNDDENDHGHSDLDGLQQPTPQHEQLPTGPTIKSRTDAPPDTHEPVSDDRTENDAIVESTALPKGWTKIPIDHPYLDRNELGRPVDKISDKSPDGDTIGTRVRLRNRNNFASDCAPAFAARVKYDAQDLATDHVVPRHFGEAMQSPDRKHWLHAIDEELSALRKLGCYQLLSQSQVPKAAHVIGYTWVFKIKIHADGSVARYKARICVDGSRQQHGIDYSETFAPVANCATIRLVIAASVHHALKLHQFDIKLAFCAAKIDRPVFMRSPAGSGEPRTSVWRLLLSLYGLKQAPRLFNAKLHSVLEALGWKQSRHDPCLYHCFDGGLSLLAVVVDDLLLATKNKAFAAKFNSEMSTHFDFKSLGTPSYMIGMHLMSTPNGIRVSQRQYVSDIGTKHSDLLTDLKPVSTPAPADLRLVSTGLSGSDPSPPTDSKVYRSLVGSLMYAVVTRPDVAVAVSICARYLAKPTKAHLDLAVRTLRYLLHTKHLGLEYTTTQSPVLETYVDASWAADHATRRSRYGFAIYYGNALISWRSKLHSCICLSTAEAEYVGATEAVKETMWLRHLLQDIGLGQDGATVVHEDNAACIKMASNKVVSGRNKHMEIKMHYVRERLEAGDIELRYISTTEQRADALTKTLARPAFERFRRLLMAPAAI
jgi:hypothetical protein